MVQLAISYMPLNCAAYKKEQNARRSWDNPIGPSASGYFSYKLSMKRSIVWKFHLFRELIHKYRCFGDLEDGHRGHRKLAEGGFGTSMVFCQVGKGRQGELSTFQWKRREKHG